MYVLYGIARPACTISDKSEREYAPNSLIPGDMIGLPNWHEACVKGKHRPAKDDHETHCHRHAPGCGLAPTNGSLDTSWLNANTYYFGNPQTSPRSHVRCFAFRTTGMDWYGPWPPWGPAVDLVAQRSRSHITDKTRGGTGEFARCARCACAADTSATRAGSANAPQTACAKAACAKATRAQTAYAQGRPACAAAHANAAGRARSRCSTTRRNH